jgi:RimJ/RimL family protein N-acetyltransferase
MYPSDLDLIGIQAATLFTHDENGRIRETNEPGPTRAPRFFLGRTKGGNIWRFRDDLPDDLIRRLEALASSEPASANLKDAPIYEQQFREVLQAHSEIRKTDAGPAYRFPDLTPCAPGTVVIHPDNLGLVADGFPWLISELTACQPCVAVVEQGAAVSVCWSSRVGSQAAEAGVETLEGFRGRGYATSAAAGWGAAVRGLGRLPLYSTSWENAASQGVARKLGLVLYGVDLSFD